MDEVIIQALENIGSESFRCVLRVGTTMDGGQHHTVEFSIGGDPESESDLAKGLREVADIMEAPSIPMDPDL